MPRVLILDSIIEEMKKEGHDYNYTRWVGINFDGWGSDFILKKYDDEKNGYGAEIYDGDGRYYAYDDDEEKAANAVLNKLGYYYENGIIHCMFPEE